MERENGMPDRKSTRLNSSHGYISYAVFCLKKKQTKIQKKNVSVALWKAGSGVSAVRLMTRVTEQYTPVISCLSHIACLFFFFFFFKDRGPPEISPFPLPAAFPI